MPRELLQIKIDYEKFAESQKVGVKSSLTVYSNLNGLLD